MKVGICWAGGPLHRNDVNRSSPFEAWAPLFAVPGVTLRSMLPPDHARADEWRNHPWAAALETPLAKGDFYDSAPHVRALDLLITVDTAVGHLAGAMDVPTWLLLATSPDFRWGLDTDRTPWYPNHRLYRQAKRGQWEPVLDRVAADLATLAQKAA